MIRLYRCELSTTQEEKLFLNAVAEVKWAKIAFVVLHFDYKRQLLK